MLNQLWNKQYHEMLWGSTLWAVHSVFTTLALKRLEGYEH